MTLLLTDIMAKMDARILSEYLLHTLIAISKLIKKYLQTIYTH